MEPIRHVRTARLVRLERYNLRRQHAITRRGIVKQEKDRQRRKEQERARQYKQQQDERDRLERATWIETMPPDVRWVFDVLQTHESIATKRWEATYRVDRLLAKWFATWPHLPKPVIDTILLAYIGPDHWTAPAACLVKSCRPCLVESCQTCPTYWVSYVKIESHRYHDYRKWDYQTWTAKPQWTCERCRVEYTPCTQCQTYCELLNTQPQLFTGEHAISRSLATPGMHTYRFLVGKANGHESGSMKSRCTTRYCFYNQT